MERETPNFADEIKACIADAYWILLNPGAGNVASANRLYERLKSIQASLPVPAVSDGAASAAAEEK